MHPILFHVGSFPVRMYSLAILTALLGSAYFATWLGRRRAISWANLYSDFWTWAFMGGVVGARVWEVAFNWSYYRSVPREIVAVWEGGLSIQGAVIGGLIAALIYARTHKVPLGRFLDGLAPALLLGQAIGRLFGCAMNGDAYGKPTGTAFGIVHAPGTNAYDAFGAQPLWPAEMFEGVFDLVLMAVLLRMGINRGPAGRHFLLYAVMYSVGRFLLEFLRADTAPVIAGFTAAQAGSLAVAFLGSILLLLQVMAGKTARGKAHSS